MSSKGTIFLTNDNIHWYEELNSINSKGQHGNVVMEINVKDIVNFSLDSEGLILEIDGECEMAKHIKSKLYE